MKTTIPACLYDITSHDENLIINEMNNYSFMNRYAYKRLQEGEANGVLEKILSSKTNMNIRFAKDAVKDANELISSRKALMKNYFDFWTSRFEKTNNKYQKRLNIPTVNKKSKYMKGLESKLKKQQQKISHYENHIKNNTYDEVIFGGKENFKKRSKNQITKEQWWEFRNGRLSARGDATKEGNPNLRVILENDLFFLEMSTSKMNQKKTRYVKVRFPLYIARKQSKKTGNMNGRNYPQLMKQVLASGKAYQVEILKRNGKFLVNITVNEKPAEIVTFPINGYKAFDTNPDGLAICHMTKEGNPLSFSWIGDGGLQDYPSNKRENLIYGLCHQFVKSCVKDGTGIIGEDLKFINDKQVNSKFNRMSHSFCYRKILQTIERLCLRYGVEFVKVKPAYTSIIGRLKYQQRHRISVHQSAALVIGRRFLKKKETVPKKLQKMLTKKQRETFHLKTEWGQWELVRKRIVNLLKKRSAKYYQWFDYRKDVFKTLKI